MHERPFFSIILPTYNRSQKLVNACDSIRNQNFTDYEIIIVDDGSTDNTKEVVQEILMTYSNIRYFYKVNEERSIARNFGIEKAEGKYISFLDSDDILYPNHLQVAYSLLQRNNFPEVGHLGFEMIDENGNRLSVVNNLDVTFKEKLIHNNFLHCNAIFIRNDIARQIHFIPSKFAILSEDWYVWLRLAARYPFYFDNTVTSAVIHHKERSLMQIDPDKLILNTQILIKYFKKDNIFLSAYNRLVNYHFANHYIFLSLILAISKGRQLQTLHFLWQAFKYDYSVFFRKTFWAVLKNLVLPK